MCRWLLFWTGLVHETLPDQTKAEWNHSCQVLPKLNVEMGQIRTKQTSAHKEWGDSQQPNPKGSSLHGAGDKEVPCLTWEENIIENNLLCILFPLSSVLATTPNSSARLHRALLVLPCSTASSKSQLWMYCNWIFSLTKKSRGSNSHPCALTLSHPELSTLPSEGPNRKKNKTD